MFQNPFKLAALALAGIMLGGIGLLAYPVRAEEPSAASRPEAPRSTLAPEDLTRACALIRPQPGEAKWMDIPWEIDVWQARKKAAAEGKPIFFLTGGGKSPLGDC
jgi:hypothetical protein